MQRATKSSEQGSEIWHAATWYQALFLTERLPWGPGPAPDTASMDAELVAAAISRLHEWKSQTPFDKDGWFGRRLDHESLSEEILLSLLGEPAVRLQARTSGPPDWLRVLEAAYASPDAAVLDGLPLLLRTLGAEHPLADCLPPISPLVQSGLITVDRVLDQLQREHAWLALDRERLRQGLLNGLLPSLLFAVSKPVILELHIASLRGLLRGDSPEDRYADFLRHFGQDETILSFLAKYPVLARHLVTTVNQWAGYACEFLTHLRADWKIIKETFFSDSDPGPLVNVQMGMGDRHRRGRTVLLLEFGSGAQLLYKPKSLAIDVHFQALLAWLNEQGAYPPLRTIRILDRGDYGWSEFVAASPCQSAEEVQRFYERQGSYLALLYVLNAGDMHNENLIAVGEHPVIVDLEALFHPRLAVDAEPSGRNLAAESLEESVWQVGLLPRRLWASRDSAGIDTSGLGGLPGQVGPHRLFHWQDPGTDRMRLVRERAPMPASQNRPRLDGEDVNVLEYRDRVAAGFNRMYRLLCEQRYALIQRLADFAHVPIRVLLRSTQVYAVLLYESFHPDLLRDSLDRARFFDHLWRDVDRRPYLARLIPVEQRDLLRGDIPLFTTFPDSSELFTSDGESLGELFKEPSLELAKNRLRQLGERDFATQKWIVEASLATLATRDDEPPNESFGVGPERDRVIRPDLLRLAAAIGKRIAELAFENDDGAYWLALQPVGADAWGVAPAGIDLYGGTSGIALFLAYLGAITGDESYTLLAKRSLRAIRAELEEQLKSEARLGIGAFDGIGSAVYLLTHLGALWTEPALFAAAEELVEQLAQPISTDNRLDLLSGSAGCILSLLSLYAVHPSPMVLQRAMQCGDRLLATAQPRADAGAGWETLDQEPPLGGMSHGAAGIALSLLKLADYSAERRFRDVALAALTYDRSLFVPELRNWADLRRIEPRRATAEYPERGLDTAGPGCVVAWCHGAPGIGLARLGSLEHLDNLTVRNEIDIALNTTLQQGFAATDSLCHGALGNLELFVTATQLLHRPEDASAVQQGAAAIVERMDASGWRPAVPVGVDTPGFMTGLAGMGYELLRLADPDNVPSVLLLAPPCPGRSG